MDYLPKTRNEARVSNSKWFFSGLRCPHGHIDKRLVSNGTCYSCNRRATKEWEGKKSKEKEDRDLLKGITSRGYAVSKGLNRYFTGKECINGHRSERRTSDAKCMRCVVLKNRARREKNPEYFKKHLEEFLGRNPEYQRAINAKRRARKIGNGGSFSQNELKTLISLQNNKCASCYLKIKGRNFHADHIKPIFLGGDSNISNIQILCPSCNLKKGAKDPIEWAQKEKGMLL